MPRYPQLCANGPQTGLGLGWPTRATRDSPEVRAAVDAGEALAAPAHGQVLLHLRLLHGLAARVAGEKHHVSLSAVVCSVRGRL